MRKKFALLALLIAGCCAFQGIGGKGGIGGKAGAGGGTASGGGIVILSTVLSATQAQLGVSGNGSSTTAINLTGATLIVLTEADASASLASPTDSSSNTWIGLGLYEDTGPNYWNETFYCYPCTVSASQTFTAHGSTPRLVMIAASGTLTASSPIDGSGAGGSDLFGTTCQPGSQTPSATGELLVSGLAIGTNAATGSVNDSLSILNTTAGTGTYPQTYLGYLIDSSSSAINPTWTASSSYTLVCTAGLFKHA
jgi:hypothetical protein